MQSNEFLTDAENNKAVFDILADTESKLFYAKIRNGDNKAIDEAHKAVKGAFAEFAKATGCRLCLD